MAEGGIELEGIVTEALPGAKFRVISEVGGTTHEIMCRLSGKLRINYIKVLVGDRVTVEVSPYDLTQGRITWRNK